MGKWAGVDFFFGNRSHALKFNDFLSSVVPIKTRNDKQLVSHDEHAGTYNYKFTFSVKLVPLCKEDLCLLPHKAHSLPPPLPYTTAAPSPSPRSRELSTKVGVDSALRNVL